MNTFGRNFRVAVFGESHGECIGCTLDGVPPGIPVLEADFVEDIARRKSGATGTTTRIEEDIPKIISGIFNGFTTGAPLTILFENNNTQSKDYSEFRDVFRPGHADFVAQHKYKGFQDYRGGGHFSGRLTLALVAAGVIAKKIVSTLHIHSKVVEVGGFENIDEGIQYAIANNDSIGGIVECRVQNMPVGLGEPFWDSLEGVLSHAVFAIPAVKGIEFGVGFQAAKLFGSQHNDVYINEEGKTLTNNSGGISGGISNGNDLIFRVAIKPTSSTPKEQMTFKKSTQKIDSLVVKGRHDWCIALRVPVVLEAVTAIVLADFML